MCKPGRVLPRARPCQRPALGLPASRAVRNQCLPSKQSSPWRGVAAARADMRRCSTGFSLWLARNPMCPKQTSSAVARDRPSSQAVFPAGTCHPASPGGRTPVRTSPVSKTAVPCSGSSLPHSRKASSRKWGAHQALPLCLPSPGGRALHCLVSSVWKQ